MRLQDKVAIVTGAGRGIGRGIAIRLAEEGANVTVADVLTTEAEETVGLIRDLGREALALKVDVSNRAQVLAMVEKTREAFGGINILVNNAAVFAKKTLLEVTEDDWDRLMNVNLKGPFLCSQAVVCYWLGTKAQGKIVNIASVESVIAFPDVPYTSIPYAASKGGVAMLTKAMAFDLAPHGINVNAVGPGCTDTGRGFQDPSRRAAYEKIVPMGWIGSPRDMANAVVYLASSEADYVTGHILFVDGGLLTC